MDDLSVLNRDDRDEPIVIGCATRKNLAVHVVLKDHDATVLTAVHNKCVAGVKLDRLAVSREARHQIGSSSNRRGPTGKVVAGLEDCVIGKRIEIVFAIDESAQAFQDDFEEGIESFKSFVSGLSASSAPERSCYMVPVIFGISSSDITRIKRLFCADMPVSQKRKWTFKELSALTASTRFTRNCYLLTDTLAGTRD